MGILLNGLCFPNISPFPAFFLTVPFSNLVFVIPHSAHLHLHLHWTTISSRKIGFCSRNALCLFLLFDTKRFHLYFNLRKNIIKNINGRNTFSE